ncbi:AI-2E family transporter [Roseibacillus persicicus]|uniref:AI-2E family transporter n=1 Tax=Roseibacillus persicicus TaxID=454148 RepID=UPI00398A9666
MAYPNDFQRRTLWSGLTGLSIVLLGAILVGIIWLGGRILGYLQPVLVPLAVAGIVAYLLDPIVEWLQNHRKLSRLKAVLTVFGVFTLIVALFISFLFPKLLDQAGRLLGDDEDLGASVVRSLEKMQDKIPGARPLVDWATGPVDPSTGEVIPKPYPYPVYPRGEDGVKRFSHYINKRGEKVFVKVRPDKVQEAPATSEPPSVDSDEEVAPEDSSPENEGEELGLEAFGIEPPAENPAEVLLNEGREKASSEEESDNEEGIQTVVVSRDYMTQLKDYERKINQIKFDDTKLGHLLTDNWQILTKTGLDWLRASTKVFGLLGYLLGFLLVPVYLYYFLNESSKIKATWHQYIPLKASKFKDEVVSTLAEINSYLISFFRGQVLVSLIDGVLVGVALSIFQLPYGFLIGLALAVLGILPFIGNILCMIPAALIAFIHFGSDTPNHQWLGDSPWAYVGAVIAIFLVVQQINSLVTAPKIVGDSVGLHPMTVIFSILFWSLLLGGFLGALLAVPLTAAIKVLFSRYIWQRRVSPQLNTPMSDEALLPPVED